MQDDVLWARSTAESLRRRALVSLRDAVDPPEADRLFDGVEVRDRSWRGAAQHEPNLSVALVVSGEPIAPRASRARVERRRDLHDAL